MPDDPSLDSPAGRFILDPSGATRDALSAVLDLARHLVWIGPCVVVLSVAVFATWRWIEQWRSNRLWHHARYVEVLPPPSADMNGASALWRNLHAVVRSSRRFGTRPHVAFEMLWVPGTLRTGMWIAGSIPPGAVEQAVAAAWPGAQVVSTGETPHVVADGTALEAGKLRLAENDRFGFETEHATDPLRAVIATAGDLRDGETAAIQIVVRPALGHRRLGRAYRAARMLAKTQGDPTRSPDMRAILGKAGEPRWEGDVRYVVGVDATEKKTRPRLRGRAHALGAAFAIYAGRNRFTRRRMLDARRKLNERRFSRGDLFSTTELAAIAHLPLDDAVAGLSRAGARSAPPPPGVPSVGKVLGDSDAGRARPVALAPIDARQHVHVIGKTGSGKSTLLINQILCDIEAERGVVVIDPMGDLVTNVLDRLPKSACDRVVILDPDDKTAPPAINMLEGSDPDLAVDHLVGIFRRIFEQYWGPRTDDVLRAACLTLLRKPGSTLADVPRLLADAGFRKRYTEGIGDPVGLGGFWKWYEEMSPAQQGQVIGPVMNKLRAFLLRDYVRKVVGTSASSFDMSWVLDGGAFLARVPKGALGEESSRLLGSFVVAKTWQAATARAGKPHAERKDAALYVDECQNFLTLPQNFAEMLAEARGYGLSLVVAHQNLAQLPRDLRDAVSANARSKVIFTVSPEDAHVLERHVAPTLSEHDLSHMDAHRAAARLVVNGAETPAFTMRTRPTAPPVPGRARRARAIARGKFGRTDAQRRRPRNDPRSGSAPESPSGSVSGSPSVLRSGGVQHRDRAGKGRGDCRDGSPDCRGDG